MYLRKTAIAVFCASLTAALAACGTTASNSVTEPQVKEFKASAQALDANTGGYIEKKNNIYNTSVVSNDPNVFKAEYEAGFLQGKLQKDQIPAARDNSWDSSYLTSGSPPYPSQLPPSQAELTQAQQVLAQNWNYTLSYIRDVAKADVKTNLRRLMYRLVGIYHGATKADPQTIPFDKKWYPQFNDAEMQVTYETPSPTFMDLYYLNTTGDTYNFLPPSPANGPQSTPIPASSEHCTAFVKVTRKDIYLTHNTWSAFLDQSQALNIWVNGDFMSTNAMDPGYLGSGTDFGYTNKGLIWNETTADTTVTKARINSVWTMWRETLAEQYADSIDKFFQYISIDQSGSYMNGYMIVDVKHRKTGYVEMSWDTTVFFKPDGHKHVEVTTKPAGVSTAYDHDMVTPDHILGFNYPASLFIRNQTKSVNNRPARQVQLLAGMGAVDSIESAKDLITYTAPGNPLSIYGRWDLGYGITPTPQTVPDGSIDAKAVSATMLEPILHMRGVLDTQSSPTAFWMKYGTAAVNGKPFIWSESQWKDQKLRDVPDVVDGPWTQLRTNIR